MTLRVPLIFPKDNTYALLSHLTLFQSDEKPITYHDARRVSRPSAIMFWGMLRGRVKGKTLLTVFIIVAVATVVTAGCRLTTTLSCR
jgi:hypothetical protein